MAPLGSLMEGGKKCSIQQKISREGAKSVAFFADFL